MNGAAHPRVRGTGVGLDPTEVAEREDDAEHPDAAVEDRRGPAQAHGEEEEPGGGGDRVTGRHARDAHDDGIEETQRAGAQLVLVRVRLVQIHGVGHDYLFLGIITFSNKLSTEM